MNESVKFINLSDLSHKEQVSVFVRYVTFENNIYRICKRLIALQETNKTTGKTSTGNFFKRLKEK